MYVAIKCIIKKIIHTKYCVPIISITVFYSKGGERDFLTLFIGGYIHFCYFNNINVRNILFVT